MSKRSDIGLTDKLYWRGDNPLAPAHCYKKQFCRLERRWGFWSLCGEREITGPGTQAIQRPEVYERCPECNRLEMERRGWDKPGAVSDVHCFSHFPEHVRALPPLEEESNA